ncbi:TonB-dependent receptor plug domain-containing protein [Chitinophaga sp. SYP-B3965]|uniref:carboxypeptidase-like regulatory domain-containing protein n=1 Tax=Chitinophaga sp. SYP-B3965 TaxID=2663120 RepID=UPI001299CB6C|nr:carboxypeptidase-like regulatory domain-containing protein [Chitinophaga sp. SYP-B3965]MRG46321.1 TonB-dependent receptor plug domain-containing protein [Chitinophaga sp. SYP-B3965]
MADNQQYITPTAELIRQYLEGKLDGKTMHALEKQALDDPFLAEALEGYAKYPADQQSAMSELQRRLQERVSPASKKVRVMDYRWLAAASVLVLLCITGVLFLNRSEKQPEIAQVAPPVVVDSVKVDTAIAEEEKTQPALSLNRSAPASKPAKEIAAPEAEEAKSAPQIRIRGNSTVKDSAALVLLDGVPVNVDSINPTEIADMKVLKDASATALYGARAANGAVVITSIKAKQAAERRYGGVPAPRSLDSGYSFFSKNIDTVYIGSNKPKPGELDSKVEGLVTGAKSNFSNYYTDDNVRKISGVVVDEKTGKRMPGVTILLKGTSKGAVTDTAGSFALFAAKDKAELAFSFLGYDKKEVTVPLSTSNLNVALPANNERLTETVIAGYSNKAKKTLQQSPYPLIGDEAYSIYLITIKTIEIPDLKTPVTGSVQISFSVMPDSTLQDFKVLQGLGKTADSIAIQHIKEGPKWLPASNNKKATVKVLVPVGLIKKSE